MSLAVDFQGIKTWKCLLATRALHRAGFFLLEFDSHDNITAAENINTWDLGGFTKHDLLLSFLILMKLLYPLHPLEMTQRPTIILQGTSLCKLYLLSLGFLDA